MNQWPPPMVRGSALWATHLTMRAERRRGIRRLLGSEGKNVFLVSAFPPPATLVLRGPCGAPQDEGCYRRAP
ncbi:hypothetical protein J2Z84_003438 [Agrobacterium rubi]|nr:hypothetical protein [Agrobacterium rubi]